MLSLDEAFAAYAERVSAIPSTEVGLDEAIGCVLAADVVSLVDLPPFPQSAMDGYALRSSDLSAATDDAPVRLPIAMTVAASGLDAAPVLAPGTCARIFTGGYVPDGADAVVMQELVHRDGELAEFRRPAESGENRRPRADEIRAGEPVMRAGGRLTPGRIGAIAAAGVARVHVRRRPRVSVLVTGDEVVSVGRDLRPG